ncbi:uncharacterized protein LOC125501079 isoform X2 [Athalia rosae]|uniref:uncharacterized protein LOC125501079 isoform X2 n=1 Tax=Athalia rosae TaxID=37344 RepID=UPI002033ECC6|nr:uncharacterized protein LOC125501079 isoform X2 [Athalia rosae]
MSATLPSPLHLLLLLAPSAFGGFPFAYQSAAYHPLASGPHLIYSSPIDGGFLLSGFSYFTRGLDGERSEVVFVSGPDSEKQMNNEVAAMRDMIVTNSGESNAAANTEVEGSAQAARVVPAKTETAPESATAEKSDAAAAADSPKDATENAATDPAAPAGAIGGQYLPAKGSGFRAPYPLVRLAGSLSYYPQLTTGPFSGFGGFSDYEPSDYPISQYPQPFYNRYDSYQSLFDQAFPSAEGYFVPPYPSIYQNPTIPAISSTNFISDDSSTPLSVEPSANLMKFTEELQDVIELDRRINSGEGVGTKSQGTTVEPEVSLKGDENPTTVEAEVEATSEKSTTTEQSVGEKSTETAAPISSSETPSTSAEPTETSTSVADEA